MQRVILFRLAAIAVLIAVAAVMTVIGRGHTVYIDNKSFDYSGTNYSANEVEITAGGEDVGVLQEGDRGMAICIGQTFSMELAITQESGEERRLTVTMPLPYGMDGIIVNLPAVLAGLPEEVYLTEFVPVPEAPSEEDEQIPAEDEGMLGDI